jgi:uracil-DNA glycosylase family 4
VNAKERLRQYLEQRRELGESELVLDGLSIEDVLRMVGARGDAAPPQAPGSPTAPPSRGRDVGAPADHPSLDRPWGATGGVLDAADETATPVDRTGGPAPAPPTAERNVPGTADVTDWREALRASGSAPDQLGRPAAPRNPTENEMAAKRGAAKAARPDSGGQPGDGMAESSAPGAAAVPDAPAGQQPSSARGDASWDIPGIDAPTGLVVGMTAGERPAGPFDQLDTLEAIADTVRGCTRCPLYATAKNGVPGEGDPDADLVCVGEAPGENEDETGRPFVGASGQLLTKILAAISLKREDVFICNVVKHRPPANRNPKPDEVEACSPYLVRQLELVKPKVILAFGTFAAQTLLATKTPIGKLRGSVHRYYGVPLIVTYHPAALLRNPAWKRPAWEDVQLARRILDRATGA